MGKESNKKKSEQLGMNHSTAANRLRKMIMFDMMQALEINSCHQCGKKIERIEDLSVEHKIPWLDSDDPVGLYFNLNNIAFSHLSCNSGAGRRKESKHGTPWMYHKGCRCIACKESRSRNRKKYKGRGYRN